MGCDICNVCLNIITFACEKALFRPKWLKYLLLSLICILFFRWGLRRWVIQQTNKLLNIKLLLYLKYITCLVGLKKGGSPSHFDLVSWGCQWFLYPGMCSISLSYCKTGKKTFQLVLHCKTSCKAMLCTLTPTFKPVLQQIKFLQVVWILTFDWIKLCECHTIHGIYVNCCNTSLLWSRKRTTCTADFVAKRSCPYYRTFTEDLWYYTMVWFHIFSHIVSRCIINEKSPKIL